MSSIARQVLTTAIVSICLFGAGYFSAIYFNHHAEADHNHEDPHDHEAGVADHSDDHHDDEHDHHDDEEDHVALTEQAFRNLDLKISALTPREYWKSQTVPGEVVAIPGRSKLAVSAPVTGIIESVAVSPGQQADPKSQLFRMRITDQSLMEAQSQLLAGMTRTTVLQQEIARLAPLSASGAIAGRRSRDLRIELSQLQASQNVLRQRLQSGGLPEDTIHRLVSHQTLASSMAVTVSDTGNGPTIAENPSIRRISHHNPATAPKYVVEDVRVHPGTTLQKGDPICTLVDHSRLQIRGEAFQSDLPLLEQLAEQGWQVSAEFTHDHSRTVEQRQLELLRIDNAIATESQTVTFYLNLPNEVANELRPSDGVSYVHWRFKPGQRVHLRVPTERWTDQLVLPVDAIVSEGPNVIVFAEHHHDDDHEDHDHDHEGHDGHDHDGHDHEDEVFIELEPIPVQLLHRDDRFAVIANDGQIAPEDQVVLNAAYELYQAMKAQAGGGGGGHHHDHE